MGLISFAKDVVGAGLQGVSGAVQSAAWKEYFQSGDLSNGVLMKRAEKILVDGGKNTKADDNLISSGSGIDVAPGQCMIIVENGAIVEFCAEPGRYTYDSSSAPSLFSGENKGLKAVGKEILNQWSAGGQRNSTQRVYFINLGEIIAEPIKWGCGNIAFHNVTMVGPSPIELDMTLKGNGLVTIKISDPMKFFTEIGAQRIGQDGEATIRLSDEGIAENLKSGILDKISSAISKLGTEERISYTAIGSKADIVASYINDMLSNEWAGKRGFEISSFTVNGSFVPTEEDMKSLKDLQNAFNMGNNLNAANYDVQKTMARGVEAAGENGGANGLFGLGMGMNMMGGANMGNMANQNPVVVAAAVSHAQSWKCTCGTDNTGKFCVNCGAKQGGAPASITWTCSCGSQNGADAKFCTNCGTKKPVVKKFVCDKCGFTPAEGQTPKFCPECGDIFNDADIVED
ncbi:MAG: SPFH domain-containing protein [Oscillospiraceae bacterium]|nr:SPFH domain-containing protein [Oscillospiraceae bacterium]